MCVKLENISIQNETPFTYLYKGQTRKIIITENILAYQKANFVRGIDLTYALFLLNYALDYTSIGGGTLSHIVYSLPVT